MKKFISLVIVLALLSAFPLQSFAVNCQYATTQSFLDYLDQRGVCYNWLGLSSSGDEQVRVSYSGDNKDEILRAYMEKKMDELQKKEGGDIEIERASGYINDEYWHIYFVNIKKDENISFVYMAHIEDDCLAFVTMVSSSASSQSTIDSIFAELIASITIK